MKMFKLLIIVFSFFFVVNTNAASCKNQEMIKSANKVTITYQYDETNTEYQTFNIIINGLEADMFMIDDGSLARIDGTGDTIIKSNYYAGSLYSFRIFAKNGECKDNRIRTITLSLPQYNYYADTDTCKKYPDFELCDKWYQGNIKNEEFNEKIITYLNKSNVDDEKNTNIGVIFNNTFNFIKTNWIYFGLGLFLLVGLITWRTINKKRKAKL